MKILNNKLWMVVILIAVLLVSGCSLPKQSDNDHDGSFPITLTDAAGRTVVITQAAERIISYSPAHTETLFALGLDEKIFGVDDYSNYPDATAGIQKVGDAFSPNYEVIISLEPDLVIAVGSSETPLVARLDELGIPVIVFQPGSLDEILEDITTIGMVCDAKDQAKELTSKMKTRIDAVKEAVSRVPEAERVTVFYEVSPPGVWGLWTIGPDSFIHDLIHTAGGLNVAADTPGDYFSYSEEVLLEKDPQVILTPNPETPHELSSGNRETWDSLAGVINERIYLLDRDPVSRPGPRIVDALEAIAGVLYPDQF